MAFLNLNAGARYASPPAPDGGRPYLGSSLINNRLQAPNPLHHETYGIFDKPSFDAAFAATVVAYEAWFTDPLCVWKP